MLTYHLGAHLAVWAATLSVAPGIIMYRGAKAAMPPTPKVRISEERAFGILTGILDRFWENNWSGVCCLTVS